MYHVIWSTLCEHLCPKCLSWCAQDSLCLHVMAHSTIMRKWKWLCVGGCKCKSLISVVMEFLNMWQDATCMNITGRFCWKRMIPQYSRGHAVGWGTVQQAGRSRVRFPMVSWEFFIDVILPAALDLGLIQPLTETSTRKLTWGLKTDGVWGWQCCHL